MDGRENMRSPLDEAALELAYEIWRGRWDHIPEIKNKRVGEWTAVPRELERRCPGYSADRYFLAMVTACCSSAQRLWTDYKAGRETLRETFDCLIRATDETDFTRQVESMPDEMFYEFARHVSPARVDESGPVWDAPSLDSLALPAFGFDVERAARWKAERMKIWHLACQQRLTSRDRRVNERA